MDIWTWVNDTQEDLHRNGQERLADIVDRLPSLVVEGHHEQAEALVPEGLALARAIDHLWLEVFLRHWLAQSRIIRRNDVTHGMDEVVRLLDFAHGERTANCPQSVCVTQDFCCAYGVLDGPGYGEERLAASREALARIDASWPCFSCISTELGKALHDLGRYTECVEFCAQQLSAAALADIDVVQIELMRADALGMLGRHVDAIAILESLNIGEKQGSVQIEHALLSSREYAIVGRIEDAITALPAPAEIQPGDFVGWMLAEQAICALRAERNNATLGRTLRGFVNTLAAHGSLYKQGEIAIGAARLALARGRSAVAVLHLDYVDSLLQRLRAPQRLAGELAQLRTQTLGPAPITASAADVLATLGDDTEKNLEALIPAHAADPASEGLTLALSRAFQDLGFAELAQRELERFVIAQPSSHAVYDELMRGLVLQGDEAGLKKLAESVPEAFRATAQFRLGRLFVRGARWTEAAQAFEETRKCESQAQRSTTANLALAYRHVGRLEEALALLDELARDPDDTSDDWDRMIVATLLDRHDTVRDSARRLGFKFDGEGPIDDPYAYCDVKLPDAVGCETAYRCVRINPVVGRIVAMQAPDKPNVYRDEVLFDPVPLNPRPERPPDVDDGYIPAFGAIKVLKAGGYRSYDLDGIHPGDAAIEALEAALRAIGVHLSVRSGDAYQITVREDAPSVRGVYIFISVPRDVTGDAVRRVLVEVTGAWDQPITFRGLLEELGLAEELTRHRQIAQELRL